MLLVELLVIVVEGMFELIVEVVDYVGIGGNLELIYCFEVLLYVEVLVVVC